MESSPEELLQGLDSQQRLAAESLLGPVRIVASAGSGKTKTISHRIAYGVATGVYAPEKVLALSYTSRSAAELRARINSLGGPAVQVRTVHASALAQLRHFWPQISGVSAPKIATNKKDLLIETLKNLKIDSNQSVLRELASEIEWWKYSMLSPDGYAERATERNLETLNPAVAHSAIVEYERLKAKSKQIDWEDVLLLTLGMLKSEPRVIEQIRAQYRFFTIDEFQDISPLQFELLREWLGDRSDLCVVGDPRQTIYTFAGASQGFLNGFASHFENTNSIELSNNYRSGSSIVNLANKLMQDLPAMTSITGVGQIQSESYTNESQEAAAVAAMISEDLDQAIPANEIAVLFRINNQAELIGEKLSDLGIRHQIKTAEKFFQLPSVSRAVQMIRASRFIEDKPAHEIVADILRDLGWSQNPSGDLSNWESLQALYEVLTENQLTIEQTVQLIDSLQLQHFEPVRELVTLSTIHAAKGLEFRKVYLIGASEGLLPFHLAKSESEIDEERRLAYVAITRAKQSLVITHAKSNGEMSKFLHGVVGSHTLS